MTINIIKETPVNFHFHYKVLAERVIRAVLEQECFPYEAEVTLTITDDDAIRELNRETRQIDAATDVLSFPMVEYEAPADYGLLEDDPEDCMNPDTGEVMLGDIVLSADRVKSQAIAYGHSERREYAFLIAHSMLHLTGYDHMEDAEREVMEERQRLVMETLRITRDS